MDRDGQGPRGLTDPNAGQRNNLASGELFGSEAASQSAAGVHPYMEQQWLIQLS